MSPNRATGLAQIALPEPAGQPTWLQRMRRSALDWVAENGFPGHDDEDWKYTRLGPLLAIPFELAQPIDSSLTASALDVLVGNCGGPRLVFVNGHFNPQLSSLTEIPKNIRATSLRTHLHQTEESGASRLFPPPQNSFVALNSAFSEDGAYIEVPPHTTVERPIHLVFVTDGPADAAPILASPRSVIIAEANSRLTVIESYVGLRPQVSLTNAFTQVILEAGANVEHYTLQNEPATAMHLGMLAVHQPAASEFSSYALSLGASLARQEIRVALAGEGAQTQLRGLYMPRGRQHHGHVTSIDHQAPGCTSRELYKGVLDGQSRGVFKGKVVVRPGADRTDANQSNKNLLLSEGAEIDTRPQLEILADDVKCTHGAAVGQLDEEAVFYLRSRGIGQKAARDMLTYAFVSEMLGLITIPELKTLIEHAVAQQLEADSTDDREKTLAGEIRSR